MVPIFTLGGAAVLCSTRMEKFGFHQIFQCHVPPPPCPESWLENLGSPDSGKCDVGWYPNLSLGMLVCEMSNFVKLLTACHV